MMKDYLLRLRQLHQDRVQFQSQSHETTLVHSLNHQEDKYQAYIIDQMATQNRIIAVGRMATVLGRLCRVGMMEFVKRWGQQMKMIETVQISNMEKMEKIESRQSSNEATRCGENMPVEFLLVKMCTNVICRQMEKIRSLRKWQAFGEIAKFSKKKRPLEKMEKHFQTYFLRHGLQLIKNKVNHGLVVGYDKPFSDSFSMIGVEGQRKGNAVDESYLNCMLEKENVECLTCRQTRQVVVQREKEASKMKEELSYLKHLLAEKSLEIKKKQEEWDQLRKRPSEDCEQPSLMSKNSSYYSELQRQVKGGKIIRKNGSRVSEGQQISRELLGKYMRESFQLKESIDVAREMCLDVQGRLPVSYRAPLQQIIKVLSQGEEISLIDQY